MIGPNGAGKTTTMECVEGLRTPDRGHISVLGLDPRGDAYALQDRRRPAPRGAAPEADQGA
ncbi:MAG: ATP-binding cassette domain-containing protein [Vicinamibacteraceae bacterium]